MQDQIREGCKAAADMVYREWEIDLHSVISEFSDYFEALGDSSMTLLTERDRLMGLLRSGDGLRRCAFAKRDAQSVRIAGRFSGRPKSPAAQRAMTGTCQTGSSRYRRRILRFLQKLSHS